MFTLRPQAKEQEGSLDETVRVARRIVGERATLIERMVRDRDLHEKAHERRNYEDVLRRAALGWMDTQQTDR